MAKNYAKKAPAREDWDQEIPESISYHDFGQDRSTIDVGGVEMRRSLQAMPDGGAVGPALQPPGPLMRDPAGLFPVEGVAIRLHSHLQTLHNIFQED